MEEFKQGMNGRIRRKLIEASIEQWYKRATALDRNWRESRKEEERLRKKKVGGGGQKQERQSLPQPLVWQRRQPLSQQVTTGPASMEGIERTNIVVVRGSEVGVGQSTEAPLRQDFYAMEINRGRNCYACGGFGHMAHHCRNRGQRERVAEERRLEYGREGNFEHSDNLKGVENLESLD